MYIFVNVFIAVIIISESLVLPQYIYNEDARRDAYLDHIPLPELRAKVPRMTYFNM